MRKNFVVGLQLPCAAAVIVRILGVGQDVPVLVSKLADRTYVLFLSLQKNLYIVHLSVLMDIQASSPPPLLLTSSLPNNSAVPK